MFAGMNNRKTGETAMNKDSSRSHSIFTIYIETAVHDKIANKQKIKAGKLNQVDLAGSERQSKTHAVGIRLDEAKKINLSLSALGNVIKALVDGVSTHVPYRDSKLTRLLQDSLGGNTKTVMIAAISPADYNYEETLSTLRYADRAKSIKNKPKINEDPKDALLREYEAEIKTLRDMLQKMQMEGASNQMMSKVVAQMQNSMKADRNVEESVDILVKKLEGKGKKIKILEEDGSESEKGNSDNEKNFQEKLQEIENLEKEKNNINLEKERIEDQLKEQEEKLQIEQEEKSKLAELIQEMENKVVQGGQALEEKEKEQARKYR